MYLVSGSKVIQRSHEEPGIQIGETLKDLYKID